MVLWEITLATAYVLGLPRTYRLALRLQRRLISPKYPKLKDFVYKYDLPLPHYLFLDSSMDFFIVIYFRFCKCVADRNGTYENRGI